ncbi:MAG: hypothetical protein HY819_16905 [Acidobacteria bacterium]|nr:hypothetical protein [Acidobacteriota bacterium]
MSLHIFGIRHHGPGSARSLLNSLKALAPDIILVEGPPDASEVLHLAKHTDMKPPIAILLYVPDDPSRAVYYPFAVFSPEWQAITYGLKNDLPVRFMDLPQTHRLATPPVEQLVASLTNIKQDPLGWLAEAAGYQDGERWWEHMIEHRRNSTDIFEAVLEAMSELRSSDLVNDQPKLETPQENAQQEVESKEPQVTLPTLGEAHREAYMRQSIRLAQKEGYRKIAVICGAWHAPALKEPENIKEVKELAKSDSTLLKALPKVKIQATWVPWTHGRLSYFSGYGAGIESPGWYHHLWTNNKSSATQIVIRWMAKVAHFLRKEDLDVSAAHIIEGVRLAEALASLRDRPLPSLQEINEAIQTVFCFGSDLPLQLVHKKLIVGEELGEIPEETPMTPIQQDLNKEQKRLRLPIEVNAKTLDLDLRKENELARSHLLHRLSILNIPWGQIQHSGNARGTFHEIWKLEWQPDFSIRVIEAGIWGNNIHDATTAYVCDQANKAGDLPAITKLVDHTLLANLPTAVEHVLRKLQEKASLANDVTHLMAALPPLAQVMRYGNVRKTDSESVGQIVDELITRVCVGLPNACFSLNDDAAAQMYEHIVKTNQVVNLLQKEEHNKSWCSTLRQLVDKPFLHGLIAGRACRLLYDIKEFNVEETANHMSLALSVASDPVQSASWIEGFLKDSGLLLVHDIKLWQVLDVWVSSLKEEAFTILLPLLRRTFSTFEKAERRQIGELAKKGGTKASLRKSAPKEFDQVRAESTLPVLAKLLGLNL